MFRQLFSGTLQDPGLRAWLAAATSLAVCLLAGRPSIAWLKRLKVRERTEKTPIEDETLRSRIASKSGTPTMGGLFLLGGLTAGCLLWGDLRVPELWLTLACTLALAAVGAVDDLMKLHGRGYKGRGLLIRQKLTAQLLIGAAFGLAMALATERSGAEGLPASALPFLRRAGLLAAAALVLWAAAVVAGMSNATNLTDGMDGLLAGLTPFAAIVLGAACHAAGHRDSAAALGLSYAPGAAELGVFCGALTGACLGFLWFNRHPARVFMGDTGALAIGGGLAAAALIAGLEALLFLVSLVFIVEIGSSFIQVISFRAFGRRVLPVTPLHHTFEKQGLPEQQIVRGFYLWGAVAALAGVSFLQL